MYKILLFGFTSGGIAYTCLYKDKKTGETFEKILFHILKFRRCFKLHIRGYKNEPVRKVNVAPMGKTSFAPRKTLPVLSSDQEKQNIPRSRKAHPVVLQTTRKVISSDTPKKSKAKFPVRRKLMFLSPLTASFSRPSVWTAALNRITFVLLDIVILVDAAWLLFEFSSRRKPMKKAFNFGSDYK